MGDELKFRSCPNCGADDRYGNEFLSKRCPNLKKEYLREGDIEAPEGKVSKTIFQLDKVLSDTTHRDAIFQKDIQAYHEACFEDKPIEPLLHLMHNLIESKFYTVEVWSLRPEYVRDLTELWMDKVGIDLNRVKLRLAPTDKIGEAITYYSSILNESIDPLTLAFLSDVSFSNWMKEQNVHVLDSPN